MLASEPIAMCTKFVNQCVQSPCINTAAYGQCWKQPSIVSWKRGKQLGTCMVKSIASSYRELLTCSTRWISNTCLATETRSHRSHQGKPTAQTSWQRPWHRYIERLVAVRQKELGQKLLQFLAHPHPSPWSFYSLHCTLRAKETPSSCDGLILATLTSQPQPCRHLPACASHALGLQGWATMPSFYLTTGELALLRRNEQTLHDAHLTHWTHSSQHACEAMYD